MHRPGHLAQKLKHAPSLKGEAAAVICKARLSWAKMAPSEAKDRAILRLGAFEILAMPDIPSKVSIDEAVELGKIYGTKESGGFINGILDNIYNQLKQEGRLP